MAIHTKKNLTVQLLWHCRTIKYYYRIGNGLIGT